MWKSLLGLIGGKAGSTVLRHGTGVTEQVLHAQVCTERVRHSESDVRERVVIKSTDR